MLPYRFHTAVHLYGNRSQVMSKYGTTKVAHELHASVSLMFLPHLMSTVIYYRPLATLGFVLYNKKEMLPIVMSLMRLLSNTV